MSDWSTTTAVSPFEAIRALVATLPKVDNRDVSRFRRPVLLYAASTEATWIGYQDERGVWRTADGMPFLATHWRALPQPPEVK